MLINTKEMQLNFIFFSFQLQIVKSSSTSRCLWISRCYSFIQSGTGTGRHLQISPAPLIPISCSSSSPAQRIKLCLGLPGLSPPTATRMLPLTTTPNVAAATNSKHAFPESHGSDRQVRPTSLDSRDIKFL